MTRRVVITGMGAVTPVGHTARESWQTVVEGRSGIGWLSHFDTSNYPVKIAGQVENWNPENHIGRKEVRRRDRYQVLAHVAAMQAAEDAGITLDTEAARERAAICIGSSIGGMTSFSEQLHNIDDNGPRRMAPFGILSFMTTTGSSMAGMELGINGPSYILTSACATGSDCVGHVFDQIRLGRVDVALAGAAEAPILPVSIAGFDRLGACTHENQIPARGMRPFDRDRKGLVVAEAAAVLVLEALETAMARGANILAELIGYGATSDAFHIVAPHPEGRGATAAIRKAMADARVEAEDLDYINAHGTGTLLNDTMETYAIKHALGETAYNVPVSSTKSVTGHAMGASGAMEAIFSVMALSEQVA
ncbi:MAG: beta-ketoacyl-[acyl-carrier-protein] synthase family protein, partial [Chloroflexota bacterium]